MSHVGWRLARVRGTGIAVAFGLAVGCVLASGSALRAADEAADWSAQQIPKLPKGEQAVRLFDGKSLAGWEGQIARHWSVENGEIVGRNGKENAPAASTYLVTKEKFRNFRLICESKLVTSEMHSGIALWGKTVEKSNDPFSYEGHLVMYPSGYGFYDLYRRASIYRDDGRAKKAGKQHDWNRMEILAIGARIRHVINGQLVADWTDPKPELCGTGPIGLQLHSNSVPQEVRWRGLVLTKDPQDVLVTVEAPATGAATGTSSATGTAAAPAGAAANGAVADPASAGFDAAKLAQVPARMQEFVDRHHASGVVALVLKDGRVVHHSAVGLADVEAGRKMTPDDVFAIASMTKPITATALMILVDEGKVKLDDPASKYVPEFKETVLEGGAKPQREITVRDLLTHTNGIPGAQQNEGTLAETAAKFAARKLAFEPGSKWQYGPGLSICGRIVEVVSGKPFETFLAERIFEPLGMKDTTFTPDAAQKARVARLYQPSPDKKSLVPAQHWITDFAAPVTPNPSGGLFSTAKDLARFYAMVLEGGTLDGKKVLSKEAVAEMTRVHTGDLKTGFVPGSAWGLGWSIVREPQGTTAMLSSGSFGHGGAFGTQAWLDPHRRLALVLLIQRTNFGNSDGSDLRTVFQQTVVDALAK